MELTDYQNKILQLMIEENNNISKVSSRLEKSYFSVHKIVSKLKKKGYLDKPLKGVGQFNRCSQSQGRESQQNVYSKFYRLHGVEMNITPYYFSKKYYDSYKKGTLILIDKCKVKLYQKSIEIYPKDILDFRGESLNKVTSDMLDYYIKIIKQVESDLAIGIIKDRKQNIKIVKHHYGYVNSGIEKAVEGNFIRIYGKDGKAWFQIDRSKGLKEAETIHSDTAKQDAEIVFEKHLNDWREHNPPTNSELATHCADGGIMHQIVAKEILALTKIINDQQKMITFILNNYEKK